MDDNLDFDYSFKKVLIFGAKGVGKTTLTNMMKKDIFENGSYSDDCKNLNNIIIFLNSYKLKKNFS